MHPPAQPPRCKIQVARFRAGLGRTSIRYSCNLTAMSYKRLKIWEMARELVVDIHQMTLTSLPRYELYEEGSQIRRAIKSVKTNIVEGYGRRRYRHDYIRFLVLAHASCDEAKDHLETLRETGSLVDNGVYEDLHDRIIDLSRAINGFINGVEREHESVREDPPGYEKRA
jgi:four helix bundle protein